VIVHGDPMAVRRAGRCGTFSEPVGQPFQDITKLAQDASRATEQSEGASAPRGVLTEMLADAESGFHP
jgi:hypothetical protein